MILLLSLPGRMEWLIIFMILGLLIIFPKIFYLITLQSTLNSISPQNRAMQPGHVWLYLIPLFGLVWHFIIVNKLADSIKAEADYRNIQLDVKRPGYNIGLTMCILNCFFFIPILNIFTALGGLVFWIMYWIKINEYKTELEASRNYNFMP